MRYRIAFPTLTSADEEEQILLDLGINQYIKWSLSYWNITCSPEILTMLILKYDISYYDLSRVSPENYL